MFRFLILSDRTFNLRVGFGNSIYNYYMNKNKLVILLILSVCLNCLTVKHEAGVIKKTGVIGQEDGEAFDFQGYAATSLQVIGFNFGTVINDLVFQYVDEHHSIARRVTREGFDVNKDIDVIFYMDSFSFLGKVIGRSD